LPTSLSTPQVRRHLNALSTSTPVQDGGTADLDKQPPCSQPPAILATGGRAARDRPGIQPVSPVKDHRVADGSCIRAAEGDTARRPAAGGWTALRRSKPRSAEPTGFPCELGSCLSTPGTGGVPLAVCVAPARVLCQPGSPRVPRGGRPPCRPPCRCAAFEVVAGCGRSAMVLLEHVVPSWSTSRGQMTMAPTATSGSLRGDAHLRRLLARRRAIPLPGALTLSQRQVAGRTETDRTWTAELRAESVGSTLYVRAWEFPRGRGVCRDTSRGRRLARHLDALGDRFACDQPGGYRVLGDVQRLRLGDHGFEVPQRGPRRLSGRSVDRPARFRPPPAERPLPPPTTGQIPVSPPSSSQ
jgi:hypothetical protein